MAKGATFRDSICHRYVMLSAGFSSRAFRSWSFPRSGLSPGYSGIPSWPRGLSAFRYRSVIQVKVADLMANMWCQGWRSHHSGTFLLTPDARSTGRHMDTMLLSSCRTQGDALIQDVLTHSVMPACRRNWRMFDFSGTRRSGTFRRIGNAIPGSSRGLPTCARRSNVATGSDAAGNSQGNVTMRLVGSAAFLAALWLLMSGIYKPLVIGFGLLSVVTVLFITRRMDRADRDRLAFRHSPSRIGSVSRLVAGRNRVGQTGPSRG